MRTFVDSLLPTAEELEWQYYETIDEVLFELNPIIENTISCDEE
jgi:hypothetical protein